MEREAAERHGYNELTKGMGYGVAASRLTSQLTTLRSGNGCYVNADQITTTYYDSNMWNEALNKQLGTEIIEDNQTRLPSWCNNEADMLPFYQILGEYKNKMLLPKFNTIEPYSNMNENCPSLPPTYTRPLGC
ncbi:hypothetical protein GUJ93_ZPchr0006g41783 [Zizania palustris]|uniref:Uncharacterized protein n=1 Tax=Zizania palustris TaxID=103762 RepID=A0A8J5T6M7_ZIZPA|nr:hypothetical protein GUJ93_ZPchr0006g41783 [Zizania palustris]